jgi:hypothetical protein
LRLQTLLTRHKLLLHQQVIRHAIQLQKPKLALGGRREPRASERLLRVPFASGPFCFRCFLPTRVNGAAGSYFFSFFLLASPFRSPVPPCLLGNPFDYPWPIAPPPPHAQSVCSVPIFNNYNLVTNL